MWQERIQLGHFTSVEIRCAHGTKPIPKIKLRRNLSNTFKVIVIFVARAEY
jgi:hypothetical protein